MGGVLLGGDVGEAIGIEAALERLGDRLQTCGQGPRRGRADQRGVLHREPAVLRRAADRRSSRQPYQQLPGARDQGPARFRVDRARPYRWPYVRGRQRLGGIWPFDSILSEGSESLAALTSAGRVLIVGAGLPVAGDQGCEGGRCSIEFRSRSGWSCEPVLSSMDAMGLRAWCLAQVGAVRTSRSAEHSVFKVAGKMFALSALDRTPLAVSVESSRGSAVQRAATPLPPQQTSLEHGHDRRQPARPTCARPGRFLRPRRRRTSKRTRAALTAPIA